MQAVLNDDAINQRIGANVRQLLRYREMSQAELSRRTELTEMYISDVVNSRHMPNVGSLARIAEVLLVKLDDLLDDPKNLPRRLFDLN